MKVGNFSGVSNPAMKLAITAAAALAMAGCSSDVTRFGEVASASGSRTDLTPVASIPSGAASDASGYSAGAGAPGRIASTPLAAPNPRFTAPAASSPVMSHPAMTAPATTGSLSNAQGWSAQGGTPIVVAQGETIATLSTRYGVPASALLRANGMTSASQVQPGSRLTIPVYGASGAVATPKPEHAALMAIPPAKSRIGKSDPHEKLQFVKGPEPAAKAAPAKLEHDAKLVAPKAGKPVQAMPRVEPPKARTLVAINPVKPVAPANVDHDTTGSLPPVETQPATGSDADKPEFRWPAHGKVIQSFKSGANDGINIALPEGTAIKAAESGVVAYAGSELKGYGNMVLIRHPNGFVSAYANNGDLAVKKGEQVKRGQVIAKSGQTGNVASPQLHFELRKGTTPVDPMGYLAGL